MTVGDRLWYVIDGLGTVPPIWLAVEVVSVTPTRIGIRSSPRTRSRYVTAARLTTDPPPPGVTTLAHHAMVPHV